MPRVAALLVPLFLTLGACNQTASAPPAPLTATAAPGVTPSSFQMPNGDGCSGAIAQFQAVLKNDVDVGHLSPSVYNRASSDVRQAETACAAGRDVQARSILAITKKNYGYPT